MEVLLHTFLFADISGYSTLTELEGDDVAAEVAIHFAEAVSRVAPEHGAEVVKRIGDAVLVHCVNAADAIALALRLRDGLEDCSGGRPFPHIHAGIHTGPAVWRGGEWWGATVNVAARVAASAKEGQVLLTDATRRVAGKRCEVELEEHGAKRMKNISAPVHVYSPCAKALQAA